MIIRYVDGRALLDVEALCLQLRTRDEEGVLLPPRSPATVRKHCTPVKKDEATGRNLYDLDDAREAMAGLEQRPFRPRTSRS